ncbi:hypothetical protein BKA82DRAFT_1001308 [Pisolithus tinctorius]|uniref:Uncharacterized protein n=1 Tax=Pisolithus tinctorius Marx 270 TaxID=870435 RepID=A0A0C3P732_PISTI|nr:hypothetical protein BKA82DRAFT_1001308 [Pisolithus tinctorius]KIO03391.1 hypothetical protein M404DRAFT_1001308 [Pisolithus tinctorius Marx 270]
MPHRLTDHSLRSDGSSEYRITSVQYAEYVGYSEANGVLPPYPIVVLRPGDQGPIFTVTAEDGDETYSLKVNGNTVQDLDDRVTSFEDGFNRQWIILYRGDERAYTVQERAGNSLAWTVPGPDLNHMQVLLEPLRECTPLVPAQLFNFELVNP